MVTPQEIELKEFSRSVRGYDRDEVDEFLDLIILDMQDLLSNLEVLRNENEELKLEIEEHKKSQKKVMETLESAKKLMKDISDSAEKRADIIIQNAKMDAEIILQDARNASPEAFGMRDGTELHEKVLLFKSKYRQLLKDELENLDTKSDGLLSELEKEFIPASRDTHVMNFSDILEDEDDIKIRETDDMIARLESEAEAFSQIDAAPSNSPIAKDTMVFDAKQLDELIAKKDAELRMNSRNGD